MHELQVELDYQPQQEHIIYKQLLPLTCFPTSSLCVSVSPAMFLGFISKKKKKSSPDLSVALYETLRLERCVFCLSPAYSTWATIVLLSYVEGFFRHLGPSDVLDWTVLCSGDCHVLLHSNVPHLFQPFRTSSQLCQPKLPLNS